MSALLTLAQLREAMPGLDLDAALAEGRIEATGLRNGKAREKIQSFIWPDYRLDEAFDGCALFVNPHDVRATGNAASYLTALKKLAGLGDDLRHELRGEGGQVFWTALRFEILKKPGRKKSKTLEDAVTVALRETYGARRPALYVEVMRREMRAKLGRPIGSTVFKAAMNNAFEGH